MCWLVSRSILRCTETGREKVLEVSYSLRSSLFALTAVARQRTGQLCGRDRSVLPNNGQPVFRGLCQTALLLGRILPFRIRERTRNDARRFTVDRCRSMSDSCTFFSLIQFYRKIYSFSRIIILIYQ